MIFVKLRSSLLRAVIPKALLADLLGDSRIGAMLI